MDIKKPQKKEKKFLVSNSDQTVEDILEALEGPSSQKPMKIETQKNDKSPIADRRHAAVDKINVKELHE